MEERERLDLVKLIIGGVLVAIILSLAFVRIVEPIHRFLFETDECKGAREIVQITSKNYDGISGDKNGFGWDRDELLLIQTYSSYYNAFCKYPFEFPRG